MCIRDSTTPLARHVVSTGNNDQIIDLPGMATVLGGDCLLRVPDASRPFSTALGRMYTATNQLGAYRLSATAF